jgi:hypothetical protein
MRLEIVPAKKPGADPTEIDADESSGAFAAVAVALPKRILFAEEAVLVFGSFHRHASQATIGSEFLYGVAAIFASSSDRMRFASISSPRFS